jgi:3-methylcrotonyl-CoA carboxylase alpha subunit
MSNPFRAVLVANRGEIAVRIIRACRENGLHSIAIYSDADANALHVRRADEAHRVGPPPATESYLNADGILETARKSGAEAVHPGYGFLAENADFAERCQLAGLTWIGPPPAAMRLLGDKAAAKALAERLGVPTLPGYHGQAQDDGTLRAEAERIGFPLMIKAAAGGGGRGMRLVRSLDELDEALPAARRESRAAFGDDRLLLERYLERPRHVEMQTFGDSHGNVLYLGERDCSIQRRHQKIIEEAPAPHFAEDQRKAMGDASAVLARAAGYTNAGTVEFLLDQDGRFYFLEVNTRLQVEHPVTEMVTGLDLVALQFRVAAGEALPLAQNDVQRNGHAMECRLYAEDPSSGFLPSSGRIARLFLPGGEGDEHGESLRSDSGVEQGDTVSSFYDSLLAKVIAKAPTRDMAVDRIAEALSRVSVHGVKTNLEFLRAVIATPAFAEALVHTEFIDEHELVSGLPLPPEDLLMAAAASEVLFAARARSGQPGDPWRETGPWRQSWVGAEVCYRYSGKLLRIGLSPPPVPGQQWQFELPNGHLAERRIRVAGSRILLDGPKGRSAVDVFRHATVPNTRTAVQGRRAADLELVSGLDITERGSTKPGASHDVVSAPMPGRILKLAVKPGDAVKQNQTLVVLDAMKIEHLVGAPRDGVVDKVRYKEGDQVELGAVLVELEDL